MLHTDFIDATIADDYLPPTDRYQLRDSDAEKRYGIKLTEVLQRAKANKRRLLTGTNVYCTADIANGSDTYKAIVEANGGQFHVYRSRGTNAHKSGENEISYLLSGDQPEEKRLWKKFDQMITGMGGIARIVQTEWLLDVAMAQQMLWKSTYLHQMD
jgi:hypothetical protein